MASHLTSSLSESIHASIIIQQQQHKEQRRVRNASKAAQQSLREGQSQEEDKNRTRPPPGLSVCVQCLLPMVFVGSEMCAVFSQLFTMLFLQFLGVPASLMSLSGVICGACTVLLLPIMGWLADRGHNTLVRKMKLLLLSITAFTLGLVGVAFCSASKLLATISVENATRISNHEESKVLHAPNGTAGVFANSSSHALSSLIRPQHNATGNIATLVSETLGDPTLLSPPLSPVVGYIGIVSFALLDIGFDAGISLSRAFILECSPPALHTKLLIMASLFSSVSGVVLSGVAMYDFPGVLGPMFGVDGTAAMLLVFSCCIGVIVLASFACTLTTGYVISIGRHQSNRDKEYDSLLEENRLQKAGKYYKWKLPKARSITSDSRQNSSDALLSKNSLDYPSYSALLKVSTTDLTDEHSNEQKFDKIQHQRILPPREKIENEELVIYEDKLLDTNPSNQNNLGFDDEERDDESLVSQSGSVAKKYNDDTDDGEIEMSDAEKKPGVSSILAALRSSYSLSLSTMQVYPIGDAHSRNAEDKPQGKVSDLEENAPSIMKNKKLLVLCASMFFTFSFVISFAQYAGNTLTLGVYHGDPLAPPNTEKRELYQKGIRNEALGTLFMYIAYVITSLLINTMINLIGEKPLYMVSQVLMTAAMLYFSISKTEEAYYATAVVSGAFRSTTFTLGYVLAHKFVQEQTPGNSKHTGQAVILIGFLLPCQYLLTSTFMGPLISYTGSVFVPMVYSYACGVAAMVMFSLLLCVK